jgi:hypothetical protein
MPRALYDEEQDLVLRLIGPQFPEIETISEQLRECRVEELSDGRILEFLPLHSRKLETTKRVLGEGSCRDVDGTPIVFTLLQKDGYLWRLDISRVDGQRLRGPINYSSIVALGFSQGLSLEDGTATNK